MFLKKKRIQHQSAKDGLEAVEKWKTGNFHLILVSHTCSSAGSGSTDAEVDGHSAAEDGWKGSHQTHSRDGAAEERRHPASNSIERAEP